MKNKKTLTYLLFCYFVFFLNNVITEEIQIDSTEINILKNGDVIKGSDGFEINADNNIKITGKNFEYDKKNSKLLATGNVVLIDKYESDDIGDNRISLAYRLTFRKVDSTLTEAEINPVHNKIREVLVQNFNCDLRS